MPAPQLTCDRSISLDGFSAGPNQTLEKPLGDGVDERLYTWMLDAPEENAADIAARLVTHLRYRVR